MLGFSPRQIQQQALEVLREDTAPLPPAPISALEDKKLGCKFCPHTHSGPPEFQGSQGCIMGLSSSSPPPRLQRLTPAWPLALIAHPSADTLSLPQVSSLAFSRVSPHSIPFLSRTSMLASLPGMVLRGDIFGGPLRTPPSHPHSLWMKVMSGAGLASPDTQVTTYSCPATQVTVLPASGVN